MWARVSTYQFSPENLDQALDQVNDALGSLDEQGLHRAELLVDRRSGKGDDDHCLGERGVTTGERPSCQPPTKRRSPRSRCLDP